MPSEIIYTSVPRGLQPGSFGLCVVAATSGIPPSLVEELVALSGYRHFFPPGTEPNPKNPSVYFHLTTRVGARQCHLLSRVGDAGLDYTQRNNKIAHHLVFNEDELPIAGPGWLARQDGMFSTLWNEKPSTIPPRKIAQVQCEPRACRTWETLAGDAAWAAVIVKQLKERRQIVYVIVSEHIDLLALFEEALSLVPPVERWNVTFCTWAEFLPVGYECQWRGVMAGTRLANAVKNLPGEVVIDLTMPPRPCPLSGTLAELARNGAVERIAASPSSTQTADRFVQTSREPVSHVTPPAPSAGYSIAPPHHARPPAPPLAPGRELDKRFAIAPTNGDAARSIPYWVLALPIVATILLISVVAYLLNEPDLSAARAEREQETKPQSTSESAPIEQTLPVTTSITTESKANGTVVAPAPESPPPQHDKSDQSNIPNPPRRRKPSCDHQPYLLTSLPENDGGGLSEPLTIVKLNGDCEAASLRIVSHNPKLKAKLEGDGPWKLVMLRRATAFDAGTDQTVSVADFSFEPSKEGAELRFQWHPSQEASMEERSATRKMLLVLDVTSKLDNTEFAFTFEHAVENPSITLTTADDWHWHDYEIEEGAVRPLFEVNGRGTFSSHLLNTYESLARECPRLESLGNLDPAIGLFVSKTLGSPDRKLHVYASTRSVRPLEKVFDVLTDTLQSQKNADEATRELDRLGLRQKQVSVELELLKKSPVKIEEIMASEQKHRIELDRLNAEIEKNQKLLRRENAMIKSKLQATFEINAGRDDSRIRNIDEAWSKKKSLSVDLGVYRPCLDFVKKGTWLIPVAIFGNMPKELRFVSSSSD